MNRPTLRELVLIGVTASALRVCFFLLIAAHGRLSLGEWANRGDGQSYIRCAQAILGDHSSLTEYDRRVFPGYPALIALVHLAGIPFDVAALAIDWLAAGVVAAAAARLFEDARVGWACVMLIPQYLINSTMAMSEAPMLALMLTGLLLARRRLSAAGGAVLGLAGTVRPMACFAVLGQTVADWMTDKSIRRILFLPICAGLVVLAGLAVLHHLHGDAFRGVRVYATARNTYAGRLFAWPFQSLVEESLSRRVTAGRLIYIWTHVAVTLGACVALALAWVRSRGRPGRRDGLALPWLAGNTLFVLCVGSYWGFQHFPRFTIPAMPAMFWAWRGVLPRRWYVWAILAVVVPLLMLPAATREFVVPP